MYKQASQLKLRFNTTKGTVSTEQLWDLNLSELSQSVKAVKKILKKTNDDDELSFLEDTKVTDVENELRFSILKDVYLTKKETNEKLRKSAEDKEHNQKIYARMTANNEKQLDSMSNEELQKLLK